MNRLVIKYGTKPKQMVKMALEAAALAESLDREALIGIKPNLVLDQPAALGATTHVEVVAGIIEYLRDLGCRKLMVMESSAIGYSTDRAFAVCGYDKLAAKYGIELVDLKSDPAVAADAAGLKLSICKRALGVDYLINVPVLKAHCQTDLTCALKNLKGCIPDREKRRFHSLGLHRPIAALNMALKTNLVVVDGICGDLTFEEGGNPVAMNQVIVGYDPVLVDAYAAEQIGLDPASIEYITWAEKLGVGCSDLSAAKISEYGADKRPTLPALASPLARELSKYVDARSACSICYGSLIRALAQLQKEGQLDRLRGQIKIGQEFRGRREDGVGIGACTAGLSHNLPGCPPRAKAMVSFLKTFPWY